MLGFISWHFTGEVVPSGPVEGLLVVGTLLFVVLGALVLERFFTPGALPGVNVYPVLLTRGIRGTYVYVVDAGLREHLRELLVRGA